MSCRNVLSWFELIPLFSFLGLQGRCRNCKSKISIQYPLVEFISGLIFALLFVKFENLFFTSATSFIVSYAYYAVIFSILLVIAVYDLKHKIIPDVLAFIFGLLTFAGLFFGASGFQIPSTVQFLSGIFIALPFAMLWFISGGRWMGLGDAKLCLGIGWLLGAALALSAMVVAFWSGAIIGIALVLISKNTKMRKLGMKSEIPFAPFLVLGTFLAFILNFNFFNF